MKPKGIPSPSVGTSLRHESNALRSPATGLAGPSTTVSATGSSATMTPGSSGLQPRSLANRSAPNVVPRNANPSAQQRTLALLGDARALAQQAHELAPASTTTPTPTGAADVPVRERRAANTAGPFKRMADAFNRAPVEVGGPIPGITATFDAPRRPGLPPARPATQAAPSAHDADQVLHECSELTQAARSLLANSLQEEPASVWERPARSRANKFVTRVVPWFKPRSLKEVATLQKRPAPVPAKPSPEATPATATQIANTLIEQIEQREAACATAQSQLAEAQARQQTAQAIHTPAQQRHQEAVQRLEQALAQAARAPAADATRPPATVVQARASAALARQALDAAEKQATHAEQQLQGALHTSHQALDDLHRAVATVQLHDVGARMLSADLSAQRLAFTQTQLAATKQRLYAIQSESGQQVRSLDRLIDSHVELKQQLKTLLQDVERDHLLAQAEHARLSSSLHHAERTLQRAQKAQPRLRTTAHHQALQPQRDAIALLHAQQADAERAIHESNERLAQIQNDPLLHGLDADLERLSQERTRAAARLAATHDGVDAVLKATLNFSAASGKVAQQKDQSADAFERVASRYFSALASHPPGFAPTPAAQAFGRQLAGAVKQAPTNPAADALPQVALMEIAGYAISGVTDGKPERAAALLQAISLHGSQYWLDKADPAHAASVTATDKDALALLRMMSVVPRGAEVMHLLGANQGAIPGSPDLQALRAFWSANQAHTLETSAPVQQWLAGAQQVAKLQLQGASTEHLPDVDKAAYNAVRNGFLSNAPGSPYDRHDQRMRKMTNEWVDRASATSDRSLIERLTPNAQNLKNLNPMANKSPYRRQVLTQITDMAERFGMSTNRAVADQAIKARIQALAGLSSQLPAAAHGPDAAAIPREDRLFDTSVQVLMEHLSRIDHPSQALLGPKDFQAIRRTVAQRMLEAEPHSGPNLLRKLRPGGKELPPLFEEMAKQSTTPLELLRGVGDYLKLQGAGALPDADLQQLKNNPDVHEADDAARIKQFSSKEDIVRFFKPLLLDWGLRDKLKLSDGGAVGAGVPFLPYSWISPLVSPIFSANASRKDEAFMQIFMPILGPEISIGSGKTHAGEVTLGVGIGPQVAPHTVVQASLSGKAAHQHTSSEATVVRYLRARGQDEQLRGQMLNALDSMVRWDQLQPDKGPAYSGPLEALLARNPTAILAQASSEIATTTLESHLGVDVRAKGVGGAGNQAYSGGLSVGINGRAEKISERRNEEGGHVSVKADKGDTRQQKLLAGVQLGALTPANSAPHYGGGVPTTLRADRRIFWNFDKHSISPFLIGGKQDADLDRHYDSPVDMQAEITANRQSWLQRCMDTLEPDASGNKDTPANRELAARLLHDFEQEIDHLGRTSNFCQYNVNYSMKPQASAWIDSFRALETLAHARGDDEGQDRSQLAARDVLQQSSTWRPLMLIVREKGKDTRNIGVNYGLRAQHVNSVEGQRTASQYPPP